MLTDQQRARAFRTIIMTQCLGMLSAYLFQNGFYLNYFTKLGFSSASYASLSALPFLFSVLLLLPFAFLSDRLGKLKLALIGQVMVAASLAVMLSAGWMPADGAMPTVIGSLLLFCVGGSLQGSSWFALLNPIIPAETRGRFFGRLRVTFMSVNILFTLGVAGMLKLTQSLWAFQLLLGVILGAHVLRYFTYARIPELEREDGEAHRNRSFFRACRQVFRIPGFAPFNAYIFLITLFTAGVPIVFGLMQKDVLHFSESQIMVTGNFFLAGTLFGCGLGGRVVDHFGTKRVFLATQVAYASVIFLLLFRSAVPWTAFVHMILCTFLFSSIIAVSGVAATSEVLALIPAVNKSLSTAVYMTLLNLGMALPGLVVSRVIEWNVLAETWTLGSAVFSRYDTLLLAFACLILLMLAAIGLVPRVVQKAQLMSGSGTPRI